MRRRSLTTRLTLSHVLVTLAGLVLLGAALLILVQRRQQSDILASLTAQAQLYAAYAAELASDTNTLAGVAPGLARRFSIVPDTRLRVFAPNGALLYASQNDLGSFPSSAAVGLLPNPLPLQPITIEGSRRFVAEQIVRGDQILGIIEVSQTGEREQALLQQLVAALVPSAALALVAAGLAGHLLARGLTRPLQHLGHVATAIGRGDLTARSQDASEDEIGRVAAQLNRMAAELQAHIAEVERLADARQQFYRSVSHELRTPLTAIRAAAENLEDDASEGQHEALAVIQSEGARLQRLVEELLNPRDGAPAPLRRRQAVDVGVLVAEALRIMQPRAERLGVRLQGTAQPGLVVSGDPDRLKQALLNLIDNALTWTPAGGTIDVTATRRGTSAYLTVHDTGTGIDPAVRPAVWKRGYSTSGSEGLGLALVQEIMEAHHGAATILDGPGATIALSLPLEEPSRALKPIPPSL